MAHHQDAIPSIRSRPSASVSRTPCADTTGSGGTTAGIGPYGCHTRPRSSSSNSSHNVGVTLLGPATGPTADRWPDHGPSLPAAVAARILVVRVWRPPPGSGGPGPPESVVGP